MERRRHTTVLTGAVAIVVAPRFRTMLRLLFVDDDSADLAALRNALRAFRRDWDMSFCGTAAEALDAFDDTEFDVVVAELKLKGADGAELLTRVRDEYPDAVRLLLCSQSEYSELFSAVGPAHQYLSKPCDPELLYDAVASAQLLNKRITKPGLKALVSQTDSLPSLPAVYLALIDELRKSDASVDRVGELIGNDLGMTAKVLQLVNSSFFGLPVHVKDAQHAAALLGLNTLRPLVLTAGVFRQLETARIPSSLLEDVMQHSLAVGCLAKRIALAEGFESEGADDALMAGILHDVGKLILADQLGSNYTLVAAAAEQTHLPLRLAELDQFDASHADVGGYLAGLWGLPQAIVEAIAFHHDPGHHPGSGFSALTAVYAANALWHAQNPPSGMPSLTSSQLDEAYLHRLGSHNRIGQWQQLAADSAAVAAVAN